MARAKHIIRGDGLVACMLGVRVPGVGSAVVDVVSAAGVDDIATSI